MRRLGSEAEYHHFVRRNDGALVEEGLQTETLICHKEMLLTCFRRNSDENLASTG
jgi:hypothetical protein